MPASSQKYGGMPLDRSAAPQSPPSTSGMYATTSDRDQIPLSECPPRVPYHDATPTVMVAPSYQSMMHGPRLTPRDVLGVPENARYPTVPNYSRNEFVCPFDSANRDTDQFPEPNGFLYSIELGNENFLIHSISLGTLEIPLTQYTVEEEWSRVYFDEGYVFPVMDDPTNITRIMTLVNADRNETLDFIIPAHVNPIDSVVPIAGGFRITTRFEHGLEVLPIWDWELPRIIGQSVDASLLTLSVNNVNVIDPFTFDFFTTAPSIASGPGSYVYFPRYPSPQHVADAINHLLSQSDSDWAALCQFLVSNTSLSLTLQNGGTENVFPDTTPPSFRLASLVGFQPCGCNTSRLPPSLQPLCPDIPKIADPRFLFQSRFQQKNACRNEIVARFPSSCQTFVRIPPGNYTPETYRAELEFQLNRFYFRIAPDLVSTSNSQFVFTDTTGTLQTIPIPSGQWSPQDFAAFLQTSMNTADPNGNYSVQAIRDDTTNLITFQFEELGGQHFSLEFSADGSTPDVPIRLGFDPVALRGRSLYRSSRPFVVPSLGCCSGPGSPVAERGSRNIYSVQVDTQRRTFSIIATRPPVLIATNSGAGCAGANTYLLTVPNGAPPYFTTGLKIGDVIRMVSQTTGDVYTGQVVDIPAYNQVCVTFADVLPAGDYAISHDPDANFSLYLPAPYNQQGTNSFTDASSSVRAEMLGFSPGAIMPNRPAPFNIGCVGKCRSGGCQGTATAPPNLDAATGYTSNLNYNLQHPNYLLVELELDNVSTNIQHRWASDTKHTLLAKVLVYPELRVERVVPMVVTFPTSSFVKGFAIKVLNPDHTAYKFHGRDWSGTLVLTCM